jgi:hypothetical protein
MGSDIITFISKRNIKREMDIEAQLMKFGKFYETVNLGGARNTIRPLTFEKDQFDLVEKRTQPDDIRNDSIRIDVRGCRQLKGESSPIILEHQ